APEPARRPTANRGRVPSLEHEQTYGGAGRRVRELDEEIERELQEALGGMSEAEMFGAPARRPAAPAGEKGKLKGKAGRVHGQDVFVDVPGGRSQGVLSLMQFPEGPPTIGQEVEVTIERVEDDLLILSRKGAAMQADWSTVAPGMIVEARVTETNKGGVAVDV